MDSSLTRQRVFRIGLGLCLIGVSVLAFAPLDQPPLTTWDKLDHVLAFGVLAWLADRSYPDPYPAWSKWGLLLGYGLFIEVVQHFLPYRVASALDLLADGLGILAYLALAAGLQRIGIAAKGSGSI